ncbi:tRNA (adenosine(37)-N6)-threonylcarbamoyltransferase complex dimerization subunit type 1 TsaB, partial [Candidatus Saccharibacteria bacterium]|nr:tRNA (adenosine(37)-N6)-threonylcarbamoyltransferase complex dimerization subunit type 1 TsaB [Candidatus Saccharibacteria bacterium]
MILGLRTDKPEAELYLVEDSAIVDSHKWHAHRELSDTLISKIEHLLGAHDLQVSKLDGIVVYRGPGSFTGLRIGITVANTLAYASKIKIIGTEGDDWLRDGIQA